MLERAIFFVDVFVKSASYHHRSVYADKSIMVNSGVGVVGTNSSFVIVSIFISNTRSNQDNKRFKINSGSRR